MIFEFFTRHYNNASEPFQTIKVDGLRSVQKDTHVKSPRAEQWAKDRNIDLGEYFQIVDVLTIIPLPEEGKSVPVDTRAKCFSVKELKEMHAERVEQQRKQIVRPNQSQIRTLTKK